MARRWCIPFWNGSFLLKPAMKIVIEATIRIPIVKPISRNKMVSFPMVFSTHPPFLRNSETGHVFQLSDLETEIMSSDPGNDIIRWLQPSETFGWKNPRNFPTWNYLEDCPSNKLGGKTWKNMGPIWEPKVKPGSFGNPDALGSACVFDILPVDFGCFKDLHLSIVGWY